MASATDCNPLCTAFIAILSAVCRTLSAGSPIFRDLVVFRVFSSISASRSSLLDPSPVYTLARAEVVEALASAVEALAPAVEALATVVDSGGGGVTVREPCCDAIA